MLPLLAFYICVLSFRPFYSPCCKCLCLAGLSLWLWMWLFCFDPPCSSMAPCCPLLLEMENLFKSNERTQSYILSDFSSFLILLLPDFSTTSWASGLKEILNAMPMQRFYFYYHWMVAHGNCYASDCHEKEKLPILPKVKKLG